MPFLAPAAAWLTTTLAAGISTAFGVSLITATSIASSLISIGSSILLSTVTSALFAPKVKQQDIKRELSLPTNAPTYRFVYGEARATGTPVGTPVRGAYIWGCWILNSRPSYLPEVTLLLDKREIALTGDAFDFTEGGGATSTDALFDDGILKVWIGRGDQTAPPFDFLDEAPWAEGADEELWLATDAWQGVTVIWMRLDAGSNGKRQERWPSTPPLVEVEGKWSFVWDPRDPAQDKDDPSTWAWSENHRLCVLDALMQNPIRTYSADMLLLDTFRDAADVADEAVALNAGGTEARYIAAGVQVWDDVEVEDNINPLLLSGAADLIRVGGRLGITPGAWVAPTLTVTGFLGTSLTAVDLVPESDLVNTLRVSYVSPARGYEEAELTEWPIPGALAEDGGIPAAESFSLSFCPSATQAMRVRKILGGLLRRQETLEGVLPPEALDLIGGATVTIAIDDPIFSGFDGVYEVSSIQPGADPAGRPGAVAMRLPATLVKHSAAIYDWTPATDEEEVVDESYDAARTGVAEPGAISALTGPDTDLDAGGTVLSRILFSFDPSPSGGVTGYEWQYRVHDEDTTGVWVSGGTIEADIRNEADDVFGILSAINPSQFYDLRVRTVASGGLSDWVQIDNVAVDFTVTLNSGTGGFGGGTLDIDTPDMANFAGVKVYRAAVGADFDTATAITGLIGVNGSLTGAEVSFGIEGVNLLGNSGFDDASVWTFGGNWSHGAGVADHTSSGVNDYLQQAVSLTEGATYRWVYSRSAGGGGTIPRIIGDTNATGPASYDAGAASGSLVAPANTTAFTLIASSYVGSADDIYLFEETAGAEPHGSHDYYVVPVTGTGTEGAPAGPLTLSIT